MTKRISPPPFFVTLVLFFLLLSLSAFAQTTSPLTGTPIDVGRSVFPSFSYYGGGFLFADGTHVTWIDEASNTACSGQKPPFLGFVFHDGQPCAPITGFKYTGAVTENGCSGPTQGTFNWAGYKMVLNFGYYKGGYGRTAGCYTQVNSGTITH